MDEIVAAFAHPEARLGLVPPGASVPDRISLRDHVREAEVGAFEGERGVAQRLRFDVAVEVAPVAAGPGAGDDVDRILSYDRVAEAIAAELAAGRVSLLETLAEAVAARLLAEPQALRVILRIQKLDRGPGALGVEVLRERPAAPAPRPDPLRPRVLALAAAGAPDPLPPGPLILVAPPAPAPRAATPEAQGRVDLLAADQGAWLLAARDPRLHLAGSRTEMDWALRRGLPVLWAPARLSLDQGWTGLAHEERAARLQALWDAA